MARSTRSDGSDKAPGRSTQFRSVAGLGRRQLWTYESKRSDETNPFAEMFACYRAASNVDTDGDVILFVSTKMAHESEQSDAREAHVRYVPWSAHHEASRFLIAEASASTKPFMFAKLADTARAAHAPETPVERLEFDEEAAVETLRARGRNRPPMDAKTRAGFEQLRSELD